MRSIPTRVHGVFDYLVGAFLIAMPWLFGFAVIGGPATWVPVFMGAAVIFYSLLTDYELGLVRRLDMRAHLWLDGLAGVALLISSLFFGFYDVVLFWFPQILAGLLLLVGALTTQKHPEERTRIERVPRVR